MEFALVILPLLTLVFGVIDFGWAVNRYTVVNNAAREGVRAASLNSTEAQIKAAVLSYSSTDITPVITVTCLQPPPNQTVACSGTYDSAKAPGGTAIVRVAATHHWITPVASIFGPDMVLTKEIRMRIE